MPKVEVDESAIHTFARAADFERWLKANHRKQTEIYLRIYKKGAGVPTITPAEALDIALCYGWIDAIKKSYDAESYLQRYTPRTRKSIWSQVNREHVARLIAEQRMTPHGLAQVDAAKADGRWEAAYAPPSKMTIPDELRAAIAAHPRAEKTFATLSKQNLFALAFRIRNLKTEAGRKKRIANEVEMLARGETHHPNGKAKKRG